MACVSCHQPLILLIESDDEEEDQSMAGTEAVRSNNDSYVDDDACMQCGCHFHWQCLLDAYSMTECPNCGSGLTSKSSTGEQQILCNLKNEGGLQERLDILPLLTEETYLKTYPEERRCQAFLEFCGEGDVEAIVDLLRGDGENEADEGQSEGKSIDVLRYQDQIRTMNSGLHVAVQNQRTEIAWLLLLLASSLDLSYFPASALDAARAFDLERENQTGKLDIRNLKDGEGMTADQRAASMGGVWQEWVSSGRLKPPG